MALIGGKSAKFCTQTAKKLHTWFDLLTVPCKHSLLIRISQSVIAIDVFHLPLRCFIRSVVLLNFGFRCHGFYLCAMRRPFANIFPVPTFSIFRGATLLVVNTSYSDSSPGVLHLDSTRCPLFHPEPSALNLFALPFSLIPLPFSLFP